MRYEIILDSGELPNKCTIAPLATRQDFHIIPAKGQSLAPLRSTILLNHEGVCLSTLRVGVEGIAAIDCVWRRLGPLLRKIEQPLPVLARIPDGFVTAYPRRTKDHSDPDGGLATIEALFVAAALLGNWDPTLFSRYYFGRRFVELNQGRLIELGVAAAADRGRWPVLDRGPRNSLQRRRDRGKPVRGSRSAFSSSS